MKIVVWSFLFLIYYLKPQKPQRNSLQTAATPIESQPWQLVNTKRVWRIVVVAFVVDDVIVVKGIVVVGFAAALHPFEL